MTAQTVTSQKGLTSVVYELPEGKITIQLPDDIRAGETISGTVSVVPNGKNEQAFTKHLAKLVKYRIDFNGQHFQVTAKDQIIQCNINTNPVTQIPLNLLNAAGTNAGQANIPCTTITNPPNTQQGCTIPSHALTTTPLRITGSFDGNSSNTNCTVGGQPAQVLAESPRQSIFRFPGNMNGTQQVQVQENGRQKCSTPVSCVNMELSVGKLNLIKGEQTHIAVKITGLQGLPDTARLTIVNITPEIVVMQPSNNYFELIAPDSVSAGTYFKQFAIQSIKTGGFTVNVNFDLPNDVMLSPGSEKNNKCACAITAEIVNRSVNNPLKTYNAVVTKSCSGNGCTVGTVSYQWEIISGSASTEIADASHTKAIVTVKPKPGAKFILKLTTTLTCSDGSFCKDVKAINENDEQVPQAGDITKPETPKITSDPPIPKNPVDTTTEKFPKACARLIDVIKEPMLGGRLKSTFTGLDNSEVKLMRRDEFIALEAEGADWDQLVFECIPKQPECNESKSRKIIPLVGRVRFEWKITGKNKGSFVTLGCLKDAADAVGERAIFKPPVIPLPVTADDTTVITTITLSIIDDGSAADDGKVNKTITIKTTRKIAEADRYFVEISGGEGDLPKSPPEVNEGGDCNTIGPNWIPSNNLVEPKVILPEGVPDNDKMVLGQWIILSTPDQKDIDDAEFVCVSTIGCATAPPVIKSFPDNVEYNWEIVQGGGKFVAGNKGRFVIYEAPRTMASGVKEINVKFKVTASNPYVNKKPPVKPADVKPDDIIKRKDATKIYDEKEVKGLNGLKVYQPGVQLSQTPRTWLPKDSNDVSFTSSLVYKDKTGAWKPALEHMCRIHYFELMKVSNEKGIAMNFPVESPTIICPDLTISNDVKHEAYDNKTGGENCKDINLQARTVAPVKTYEIKVLSLDYAAYGLFRSFANMSKGSETNISSESPVYLSIPLTEKDVSFPPGRPNKFEMAKDNRVTIPYDIDGNHIADNGWVASDNVEMQDPPDLKQDEDNKPDGDNLNGDGLTTYEEYRGFMTVENGIIKHVRTNYNLKDIFIRREQKHLDISLYKTVSELNVHEINKEQYEEKTRYINFNNKKATHLLDQSGLYLIDGIKNELYMGYCMGGPSIPNNVTEVQIYTEQVQKMVDFTNAGVPEALWIDYKTKLKQVIAHELLHANNVCHHGEGDENDKRTYDNPNGL